jgi:capsular exopolysaccharide synthesis family protein
MPAGAFEQRGPVRYYHAFRAHWVLILGLAALAVVAATLVTLTATKRFQASADLQVQALPAFSGDPFQGFNLFRQTPDGASPTVAAARVLGSAQYQDLLSTRLRSQSSGVTVSLTPLAQADIVAIDATAPSAALAARAANTYASIVVTQRTALFQRDLTQKMRQIQAQIAAMPAAARTNNPTYATLAGTLGTLRGWVGSADPTLQVLTPAPVPTAASWPRTNLTLIVALVIGLLLGAAAAVVLELVNPRVTREDELALSHGLPVLARIPRIPSKTAHEYLLGRAILPPEAWKGYRTLRAVLATAGVDNGYPRSILVTSASPGDGKTMTAVNIAVALAAAELRVTLIDADFHRPMVGTIFNITSRHDGLIRLLNDPGAKNATVAAPTHARLNLVLSSREQMHQLHLFDPQRFENMLQRLAQESDVVVIDSPPVPEVAEALAIAGATEAVMVCVRIGHTRRDKLEELRSLLARRGVIPLGFVVTSRHRPEPTPSEYEYASDVPATLLRSPTPVGDRVRRYSRR